MTSTIIIGGGIAGCSTAYALAQHGVSVTLIERHAEIAQEASGNPLAMLYPKLSIKPTNQSILASQAFDFTTKILNSLPNNADFFKACGQIQLAFNAAEKAKQKELLNSTFETDYAHKNNWFCDFLTADEVSEKAGIRLKTGGLFLPNAGWVNPRLLCDKLSNYAGISLQTNSHVASIQATNKGWRVAFADGALEAENVVICNANDIKQFGFCDSAQITPVRGQVNFFAENVSSQALKTIVCSDHFISPAVSGWHSFGTSYAPNDLNAFISTQDTATNLAALRTISPEIFDAIGFDGMNKIETQGRVAWRSQTLDYLPLAGQIIDEKKLSNNPPRYNAAPKSLPWQPGLYVNAGHGSKGLITAPLCGELIASLITKNALPIDATLASSLNPSRFLLKALGLKQLANSLY